MKYVVLRFGMMKKVVLPIFLSGLLLFSLASPLQVGAEIDCPRSLRAYALDPNMKGIKCDCRNGADRMPVCSKSSSGGSSGKSSSGSSKGLSGKNQMKLQMMESVLDGAANAFIRWLNGPPESAKTGQQIADEQWELDKAEWRAKTQQQIKEMENEYQQMQEQQAKASKSKILADLKGMGNNSAERKTTALQQLQQLSCKANWAMKAAKSSLAGDEEKAAEYSRFAVKPDAAAMAECSKALPEPPMPSSAGEFRTELYETMIEEINLRLPLIKQAKVKQNGAAGQVAEKQHKVDELKAIQTAAASAGEKQAADDLLAAAMQELEAANTLKNAADAALQKLKFEVEALNEVGQMAKAPQK